MVPRTEFACDHCLIKWKVSRQGNRGLALPLRQVLLQKAKAQLEETTKQLEQNTKQRLVVQGSCTLKNTIRSSLRIANPCYSSTCGWQGEDRTLMKRKHHGLPKKQSHKGQRFLRRRISHVGLSHMAFVHPGALPPMLSISKLYTAARTGSLTHGYHFS